MKKSFIIIVLVFFVSALFAQSYTTVAGARAAGMGNAGITNEDAWSVFNNPAAYSFLKQKEIGAYYENRFMLKQTGYGAMAFSSPLFSGNIGFGFSHFGYSEFQSDKFALGYSQQLFKYFSLGVQVNYFSVRQSGYYGNLNALTFEAGVLSKPNDKLSIGAYIFNPLNQGYFEDNDAKMPITLRLGLSYLFSKSLLLSVESGKSINGYTPVFRSGIEYLINEQFAMRAGLAVAPVEYSFGLGYKQHFGNNFLGFDLAYAYHEVLGSTPKLSINYAF
jgi:long-subunit fatty acid transport protein